MAGRRGKNKGRGASTGDMGNISRALLPSLAFMAVPRTPAPVAQHVPQATELGTSQDVLNSSLVHRPRSPDDQEREEDPFSDPESSLQDYQYMEEAGYSGVDFGTINKRRSMSDREKASTPPPSRREHAIDEEPLAGYSGRMYHELEPAEVQRALDMDMADLYSVPNKAGRKTGSMSPHSLHGTTQDVRKAMKEIHDLPAESDEEVAEQVITKVVAEREQAGNVRFPAGQDNSYKEPSTHVQSSPSNESMQHQQSPADDQMELWELQAEAEASLSQHADEPTRSRSLGRPVAGGGRGTPRSGGDSYRSGGGTGSGRMTEERIRTLEKENSHLRLITEQLQTEVRSLKQVESALSEGDTDTARSMLLQKQLQDMKDEIDTLQSSVHRLTAELSVYQAKYRPVNVDKEGIVGMPSKGPIPSWLINVRYLAPLFLAYDDRILEKDEVIQKYQNDLDMLKARTEEVIKENQRLHMRGEQPGGQGPVDITDWENLKENARLVLEENQNLLEQINVKDQKAQDLHQAHVREVSKVNKQLVVARAEKSEMEQELIELRQKYRDIKQKHDALTLETQDQATLQQQINLVAELKTTINEKEEVHKKEIHTMKSKLQAVASERKSLAVHIADVTAENKRLRAEIKALHKAVRKAQNKMMFLQKAIEQSENKEFTVQEHLANIIRVAEKNAYERDTYAKVAKEQEVETKKAVSKLLQGNVSVGKMEEKLKLYKMKAIAKLGTVADRLKDQDEAFNRQKKEYEREIMHLRLLLKEKERLIDNVACDKRSVEDELEAMWQSANNENEQMRAVMRKSLRKLRQHKALKEAMDSEEKELLYVSSDGED